MIIDQLGVLFDDDAAASSMTSKVIPMMPYMGRNEVYISLLARGANQSAVTFTVAIEEGETEDGSFTSIGTVILVKPDSNSVLQGILLPKSVSKPFIRLAVTVTGTTTGVTLFAGVTRDSFEPYDVGLYIDRGTVVA